MKVSAENYVVKSAWQILQKFAHFLDEEFVNLHFEKQMNKTKVKIPGNFSCNKDNLTNFNFTLFDVFSFLFVLCNFFQKF